MRGMEHYLNGRAEAKRVRESLSRHACAPAPHEVQTAVEAPAKRFLLRPGNPACWLRSATQLPDVQHFFLDLRTTSSHQINSRTR